MQLVNFIRSERPVRNNLNMSHVDKCFRSVKKYSSMLYNISPFKISIIEQNTNILDHNSRLHFVYQKMGQYKKLRDQ